jgi:hypothetical protein
VVYLKLTDDGTHTSADLKSIVDACVTAFNTRFKAQISSSVVIENANAVWITGAGTALEYLGSYSLAGTGSTEVANAATCFVVNFSINQYYRGGHPRLYLAGVPVSVVTGLNTISAAAQAALATAGNSWITDTNALTGAHVSATQLGTVSYATGNTWRVPPVFRAFQSSGARAILGTQRRRLGGR